MTNNKCIVCGLPLTCTRFNENDNEEMNGTYDKLEEFLHEPNCCDCEFTYDGGDCDNCTMD